MDTSTMQTRNTIRNNPSNNYFQGNWPVQNRNINTNRFNNFNSSNQNSEPMDISMNSFEMGSNENFQLEAQNNFPI
jgi:hypothetical protein